eukprot:675481-Prymnesium_polylepis.2
MLIVPGVRGAGGSGEGLGAWVQSVGCRVQSTGCRAHGAWVQEVYCRVRGAGCMGAGCRGGAHMSMSISVRSLSTGRMVFMSNIFPISGPTCGRHRARV